MTNDTRPRDPRWRMFLGREWEILRKRDGVVSTRVGGNTNPTRNHAGHAEAVEIVLRPGADLLP